MSNSKLGRKTLGFYKDIHPSMRKYQSQADRELMDRARRPRRPSANQKNFRMLSKYPGVCSKCDVGVNVGDPIIWNKDTKKIHHEDCKSVVRNTD